MNRRLGPYIERVVPTREFLSAWIELLPSRVERSERGCWLWTGGLDVHGYGRVRVAGRQTQAHRLSYMSLVGPVGSRTVIDHLCFERRCVNPNHLREISVSENAANQQKALATHCKRGHEFTKENTYMQRNRHRYGAEFHRQCRACTRLSEARRRAAKLAARASEAA